MFIEIMRFICIFLKKLGQIIHTWFEERQKGYITRQKQKAIIIINSLECPDIRIMTEHSCMDIPHLAELLLYVFSNVSIRHHK